MSDLPDDLKRDIDLYQQLVQTYEALDAEIDDLLASYGGAVDQMNGSDKAKYRALFRRRDEALNEMRVMELDLIDSEDNP
ncbi:MAG: hypothetical protein J5J04_05385 [Anaerolineae bacterium]|jgi:hypothetical protein|nr:MAG: hypothetical protein UZ13_01601 [Chloroflexi bacterium OLB13]MBC6955369.1 hypothetical protein [Chloroflexota bacterium]MBV6435592.1 hypothetical protein [Anaerolineae bacterium]MDL1915683.1 hypothetical protein [Anaerolineae bacterium CFX4]OQY86592.1 MAG: hypothetical protein B6D42_00885 [Anaerolineae bacterium UTCFX5]